MATVSLLLATLTQSAALLIALYYIEQVASETSGKAMVGKINIDDSQELAVKFQIASIPTCVLLRDGEEVQRWTGIRPADEYVNAIMSASA